MSGKGRPLRFLVLVLGSWVTIRAGILLLPDIELSDRRILPTAGKGQVAEQAFTSRNLPSTPHAIVRSVSQRSVSVVAPASVAINSPLPMQLVGSPTSNLPDLAGGTMQPFRDRLETTPPVGAERNGAEAAALVSQAFTPSSWSLTGWISWRPDSRERLTQAPLLGGSQAGLRLDYRIWSEGDRSLSVYGRLSRALERPFAEEAAVGIALRPIKHLPVSLMTERRIGLGKGGRDGFAVLAAGGIGPKSIAPSLEVEGYAQTGMLVLPGSEGFADVRISIDYRLPLAKPDIALGLALSGSVQSDASRVDIGPELRLRVPVGEGHVRLSAEWRQRIKGDARPASGPVIALVADF